MKNLLFIVFFFLIPLIIGCSNNSEKLDTPHMTENHSLSDNIQGVWTVEQWVPEPNENIYLGNLIIREESYEFIPTENEYKLSSLSSRLVFFDKPSGTVSFEYLEGYSPNYDLRNLRYDDFLVICHGLGFNESFFIGIDREKKEFYFHSMVSEIQTYFIHKSYETL